MQNRPRSALRSSVFVFDPQNMVFAPVPTHPSQISCHGSQMGPGEWFWRTQGRIHHCPAKPAPLAINPLSILSHTDDNAPYFLRTPRTTHRTILVPHISKPFLNSGQANDCGSLGTQVLWEVLKLNNIQILIFSLPPPQGPTTHSVFSPAGRKENSYSVLLWINYPPGEVNTYLPGND